jgi:hypothetical protein
LKFALPEYVAMMLYGEAAACREVVQVPTPALESELAMQRTVVPFLNVNVPAGTPAPGAFTVTVALRGTAWLVTTVLAGVVGVDTVVSALLTV